MAMIPSLSPSLLRRLPLVAVALAAVLGLVFVAPWLNFDTLTRHSAALLGWRDSHYLATALGFILTYAVVVAASLPGALILTLAGGSLFGLVPGAAYNLLGAWSGAMLVFLAARTGLGHQVAAGIARRGGAPARLQLALLQNAWPVLISMRLIPVVPFFVANLLPAFVGIRLSAFALTTLVGIIPGGVIYTALGAGLGEILARGAVPDLGLILAPRFLLPLLGLAALSFLPAILRGLRRGRA